MKKILIAAMIPCYPEVDRDTEVWTINQTYNRMDLLKYNITRVYFMDDLEVLQKEGLDGYKRDFAADLNALDVDVFAKRHYDEIAKSRPLPIVEMIAEFGAPYFVCTVSYVLAHAIFEKVDEITLCGMYHPHDSSEYMQHIPCVNYWLGQALGRDIPVSVYGESSVGRAFPWESALYGYEHNEIGQVGMSFIGSCYRAARDLPRSFKRTKEFEDLGLSNPMTDGYFKAPDADSDGSEGQREEAVVQTQADHR